MYKVCQTTINFIYENMKAWKTTLHLYYSRGWMSSKHKYGPWCCAMLWRGGLCVLTTPRAVQVGALRSWQV